ncbi:MAG: hypothetical protein K0R27_527 [Xanthobacteraceae bacterium]|jgi:hypothetical protein|nr:hypothetical protein [Xanthobacteraceae bacterium]
MLRSDLSLAFALGMPVMAAAPAPACADTLPRPSVDYAATARTPSESAQMKVVHGNGRLRVEVGTAGTSGAMTGLIDPKKKRMVMLTTLPGMDKVALEMELPESLSFTDLPAEGARFGSDTVAGEPCDLWRTSEKVGSDPVEACITPDGIVMRAKATVNGKPQVVFEVVELARGPQDPAQFEVPKGVKITKVPKGMQGMIPGLGR